MRKLTALLLALLLLGAAACAEEELPAVEETFALTAEEAPEASEEALCPEEAVEGIEAAVPEELPIAVEAAAENAGSGTCGENLRWTLDADGLLTISGTGPMEDYNCSPYWGNESELNRACPWGMNITAVVVEEGVTTIGSYAFCDSNLDSITLPATLTRIGESAFASSTLSSITIGEGLETIASNAFEQCMRLTAIELPEGLTAIGSSAFRNCVNLAEAAIPATVAAIGEGAFYGCRSLSAIVIPDGITEIGRETFYSAGSLTTITLPDSLVSVSGYAFTYCTRLSEVYYQGSRASWQQVAIGWDNDPLKTAKVIYGLETGGIAGQPVDTNAARLTWARAWSADGYQLFRAEQEDGAFTWIKNCTTAVVNNYSLNPGADYWYRVRPYRDRADGSRLYGEYSDTVRVHIPGRIEGFTVTGKDTNCAFLRWDSVAGCTGYQVFRTVAGSGEYTWVKNATTAQVANYCLQPGTTYYYKIRAYVDLPDGKRAYGPYSDGVKFSVQPQTVLLKLAGGDRRITLSWSPAAQASGYQVFCAEAGTGGTYTWRRNVPAGQLAVTIGALKANTDYWFIVRSYVDLPDGGRYWGQYSEPKHAWTRK